MFNIFIRTVILYIGVIIAIRLMGKRQIGDLQPSEMVVTIMISELAAIPMGNIGTPIIVGLFPILILIVLEVSLSYGAMKSKKLRQLVSGKPSIIICDGEINKEEMRRLRMNYEDLKEELRLEGCTDIKTVKYAILETNGQLSLIPNEQGQNNR
ncbi:MAG: DUF421 domain-containing protein [Eubacteriales bacterium]|nr:DUF421 domain-containing protein [Eubacteriales bacterium]